MSKLDIGHNINKEKEKSKFAEVVKGAKIRVDE